MLLGSGTCSMLEYQYILLENVRNEGKQKLWLVYKKFPIGEGGGRGFRMGNTCAPMADSCQYMVKTTIIL